MEVFQAIGIIVASLFVYAASGVIISLIAADGDERLGWPIAWLVGGLLFAVVAYCWITGVPLPAIE